MLALTLVASVAASAPARAGTLVRYDKSGGIAGVQATLSVSDAGGVRVTRNRTARVRRFALSGAELRGLRRALREARFSTLSALYAGEHPVADGFVQQVRYAGRVVTVRDGGRPPPRLRRLLTRLAGLAAR
ncbi:MAG: hypothetical protein QOJ63_170 [Solirubrobacteraceae bacterium]|jgi:hypothetical protein|nr:hypothetical protein [Solirubrobacteraceae bacterium]